MIDILRNIDDYQITAIYFVIGLVTFVSNVIYILNDDELSEKDFLVPFLVFDFLVWPLYPIQVIVYIYLKCQEKKRYGIVKNYRNM